MSHGITIAGNPSPIRVNYGQEFSTTEAGQTRITWKGSNNSVRAAFLTMASNSASASFRQDGAVATAEITTKMPGSVIETVEIDFNASQRQWWTCPAYAVFTQLQRVTLLGEIRRLEQFIGEGHTPSEIADELQDITDSLVPPLDDAFNDLFLNGDTYIAMLPVITYTRTVSKYYAASKFVIYDIGKVFSTEAMSANVPTDPQFDVSEVTNTIAANDLQTLGWLKTGRRSINSDGGASFIQQYTFDAYPSARYQFVTAPVFVP